MKYFKAVFKLQLIFLFLAAAFVVHAQSDDSIIHFIFTSDVHLDLHKDHFRNNETVPALEVNKG